MQRPEAPPQVAPRFGDLAKHMALRAGRGGMRAIRNTLFPGGFENRAMDVMPDMPVAGEPYSMRQQMKKGRRVARDRRHGAAFDREQGWLKQQQKQQGDAQELGRRGRDLRRRQMTAWTEPEDLPRVSESYYHIRKLLSEYGQDLGPVRRGIKGQQLARATDQARLRTKLNIAREAEHQAGAPARARDEAEKAAKKAAKRKYKPLGTP